MTLFRRVAALVLLAAAPPAAAQFDVSLEALVRASENRLGVYAVNARTGAEIAFNADVARPAGALAGVAAAAAAVRGAAGTESRPIDAPTTVLALRPLTTSRPAGLADDRATPRAVAAACAALRRVAAADAENAVARAFGAGPRGPFGDALPPYLETGAFTTRDPAAPGVAGYVATPRGDVVVCVLSEGFRAPESVEPLLPLVVAACVRRLVGAIAEPAVGAPSAERTVMSATMHEATRDAALFGRAELGDGVALGADRRAHEAAAFKLGETARVGVLAFPASRTRIAVQWLIPGCTDDRRCGQTWIDGRTTSDAVFDQPLDVAGNYRVRVVYGERLILDREFFVTKP